MFATPKVSTKTYKHVYKQSLLCYNMDANRCIESFYSLFKPNKALWYNVKITQPLGGTVIKRRYNSIYKSALDAFIYLFLYIVIPISQAIQYILANDKSRFFCIILLLASLLYDCYTRYSNDMSRPESLTIFYIGVVAIVLGIISIGLHCYASSGRNLQDWVYFLYLPIIFPIIICAWELTVHVRRVMNI